MREWLSTLFWSPLEAFQEDDENCSAPHTDTVFLCPTEIYQAHVLNMDPIDLGLVVSATRNNTTRTFQGTLWSFSIGHRTNLKANYFQKTNTQSLMKTHSKWFRWQCIAGLATLITSSHEHRWSGHHVPQLHCVVGFAFKVLDVCKVAVCPDSTVWCSGKHTVKSARGPGEAARSGSTWTLAM